MAQASGRSFQEAQGLPCSLAVHVFGCISHASWGKRHSFGLSGAFPATPPLERKEKVALGMLSSSPLCEDFGEFPFNLIRVVFGFTTVAGWKRGK